MTTSGRLSSNSASCLNSPNSYSTGSGEWCDRLTRGGPLYDDTRNGGGAPIMAKRERKCDNFLSGGVRKPPPVTKICKIPNSNTRILIAVNSCYRRFEIDATRTLFIRASFLFRTADSRALFLSSTLSHIWLTAKVQKSSFLTSCRLTSPNTVV